MSQLIEDSIVELRQQIVHAYAGRRDVNMSRTDALLVNAKATLLLTEAVLELKK